MIVRDKNGNQHCGRTLAVRALAEGFQPDTLISKAASLLAVSLLSVCISSCTLLHPQDKSWTEFVTLGNTARASNKYGDAEEDYKKAAAACKKQYGNEDGRFATCLGYLGELYLAKQEWREANDVYKEMMPILERLEPNSSHLRDRKAEFAQIKQKLKEYGFDENGDPIKKDSKPQPKPTKPKKSGHGRHRRH